MRAQIFSERIRNILISMGQHARELGKREDDIPSLSHIIESAPEELQRLYLVGWNLRNQEINKEEGHNAD